MELFFYPLNSYGYTYVNSFVIVARDDEGGIIIMANLQEQANQLEQALRESKEFQDLKQAYEAVMSDEIAKQMFENFRETQLNLQEKHMQGQDISEEEIEKARQIVETVQQHDAISKLMEEEQKLNNVINEISQTITKPLEELYGAAE